jgi:hypothetical protein
MHGSYVNGAVLLISMSCHSLFSSLLHVALKLFGVPFACFLFALFYSLFRIIWIQIFSFDPSSLSLMIRPTKRYYSIAVVHTIGTVFSACIVSVHIIACC